MTPHEAAERLRRVGAGESVEAVYGVPYSDHDRQTNYEHPYHVDLRVWLAHTLSEHDPAPASIDWLSGLSREGGDMGFMAVSLIGRSIHLRCGEGDDAYVCPTPATRDSVRMFCRALGITLREQAPAERGEK